MFNAEQNVIYLGENIGKLIKGEKYRAEITTKEIIDNIKTREKHTVSKISIYDNEPPNDLMYSMKYKEEEWELV